MKRLGKKGFVLSYGLVIIYVILLISAYIALHDKFDIYGHDGIKREIGENQYMIFYTIQKGEKMMFYIDHSAKLAGKRAIVDLGKQGGFFYDSPCDSYSGYNLWFNGTTECYPDGVADADYYSNLMLLFHLYHEGYLSVYPYANIPLTGTEMVVE